METTQVFQPQPLTSRRSIAWRMMWKVLEWIMLLVGILTTAAFTLAIGWGLLTLWEAAESVPVVDGLGHDGRSAETALVIEAATESESLRATYDWFSIHRPLDTITGERLVGDGDRLFHVLEVSTWSGGTREFWFDITEPYGHE